MDCAYPTVGSKYTGSVGAWDRALFFWINRWPDGLAPVMASLSKGTDGWPMRIALLVLLIGLVRNARTRRMGLIAGLGWIAANGATDLWKRIPFARPGNELADAIVRIPMSASNGTASAHSANMAFVTAAFAYYGGWKWGAPWGVVAFLVGVSRIYVGAHYPSQVMLGWLTGVAVAGLIIGLLEWRWPRSV